MASKRPRLQSDTNVMHLSLAITFDSSYKNYDQFDSLSESTFAKATEHNPKKKTNVNNHNRHTKSKQM